MCCFISTLWLLGPRFAFLIYWLIPYGRVKIDAAFSTFFWPFLGLIFLPWTTLMYVILAPNGIVGIWEWLFLILGVVFDIASYTGGGYGNKDRIPGMA